jgi:hypothetical protein
MPEQADTVTPLDIGLLPEAAVSGAILLESEFRTFLMFNAVKGDHGSDGAVDTAIVTFEQCLLTRFGYPNDEALGGHPLYRRGLRFYGVFEVLNSSWARQVTTQNRVTFPNTTDDYAGRHFVFTFHDGTFECLARDLQVEVSSDSRISIVAKLAALLCSD